MRDNLPKIVVGMTEPVLVRRFLIAIAVLFLGLFLFFPLATVFARAMEKGVHIYWQAITDPYALSAIRLSVEVTFFSLFLNLLFGLAAAWSIGKFDFFGKEVLISLIDLPFAVSPVISGLIYVLLFGLQGYWGPWLTAHHIHILFAVPGIILATTFVTVPFVARELIPLMQIQGTEEEEASIVLGANGWQTFWHVTIPNIQWGLFYGLILTNARALGEFGAVSVVSGHILGATMTLPLHVENLYNEYNTTAAFAVASLLTLLALVTVALKNFIEWKTQNKTS